MKRLLLLLLVALAFVACGEGNKLTQGEVVGRSYDDPDIERWTTWTCVSRNRQGICTMNVPVEQVSHDGPHWYVEITGYDDEGKQRTETHEVTQTLYDLAENGVTLNLADGSVVQR